MTVVVPRNLCVGYNDQATIDRKNTCYGNLYAHTSPTVRTIQRQQQSISAQTLASEETRTGAAALSIDDMEVGPLSKRSGGRRIHNGPVTSHNVAIIDRGKYSHVRLQI